MGEGLTRVTRGTVVKPGPRLGLLAESLSSCPPEIEDSLSCSLPTGRHANWT